MHDVRLQMIFDLGHVFEAQAMADLREAGIAMLEQQRSFSWPEYKITGSIDGKIIDDGQVYPLEIKSAAPYAFDSINTIEDMKRHKWHYMRKYPAQLTLYLLMDGKERGLFLFKNKSTGALKEIWLDLDYEFAESLIAKAETINHHVAEGSLPEAMEYDEGICTDCGFAHICMPDRIGKEVEIIDDSELLELLARYDALKPSYKEYEDVDKRISELVKGREKILVGDWFIEGKWNNRKSYNVPDEIKQQYQMMTEYWQKKIMRVGG